RMGEITGNLHCGNRDQSRYAGVLQLLPEQIGQEPLNLLPEPTLSATTGHGDILRSTPPALERSRHFHDFVGFELVAYLEIVEILHREAALEARLHLAHVVLESLQRRQLA